MKMNKLLVTAIAACSMILVACNGGGKKPVPTPVEPVSRIQVSAPEAPFVVGDTFNLDTYVTVTGGEGPKVFDATVKTGTDLITLEGHNVTVKDEGSFIIEVGAGEEEGRKTANFTGEGLSLLKATFAKLTGDLTNVYGMAIHDQTKTQILETTKTFIHQENYFVQPEYQADDETEHAFGGYLKAGNGKVYEYTLEALDGELTVIPGAKKAWENYFVNMDFDLSYDDLVVVKEEIEDETAGETETLEYLRLESTVVGAWEEVFGNKASQFSYMAWGSSNLAYYTLPEYGYGYDCYMDIYPIYDEDETEIVSFQFATYLVIDGEDYIVDLVDLVVDDAELHVASIEAYVESGASPEAITFEEITEKANAAVTAKNYAVTARYGWVGDKSFEWVAWNTIGFHPSWHSVFPEANETGVVTENGKYNEFVETLYYNDEYEPLDEPTTEASQEAYLEHDSKLYYVTPNATEGYDTQDTGAAALWGSGLTLDAVLAILNGEGTAVSAKEEGEGYVKVEFEQETATLLATALLDQLLYGYYIDHYFNAQFGADYAGYIGVQATVTAEALNFFWYFRLNGGYYYAIDITFSAIGGGNVLPVTEADVFPNA